MIVVCCSPAIREVDNSMLSLNLMEGPSQVGVADMYTVHRWIKLMESC